MLYAIRNGGFSGAIMPENIVVGTEAQEVAKFLAQVLRAAGAEGADDEHHALDQIGGPAGGAQACSTSS